MAGSQLKKLRNELKQQGLIGQTNVKNKKLNKKSKTPSETRRQDQTDIINGIRQKFNVFDSKVNRVKRDVTTLQNGKLVKLGETDLNNPIKSNSFMNKQLKTAYNLSKNQKSKSGKFLDKRFGENDKNLTDEEKMLQRFIREREHQNKRSRFLLESDDEDDEFDNYEDHDDDDGFTLTHAGKVLPDEDRSGPMLVDEDVAESNKNKKKTKAEVMKEVIAKSKFYKQQRQKLHNQTQQEVQNLDEDFQDIMGEIRDTKVGNNAFSSKTPEEIEYDNKVRELVYDKRSVPADITKTEEEARKEHEDRMKKLEEDRLKRMEGDRDTEADDLDEFWEDLEEEEQPHEGESDDDIEDDQLQEKDEEVKELDSSLTFEHFMNSIQSKEPPVDYINKMVKAYQPHLRIGNKDRMNKLVGFIFRYLMINPDDEVIKVLKHLSQKYNEQLVAELKSEIAGIHQNADDQLLEKKNLIYFALSGMLFSSSDRYHLIIIPNLILMGEILIKFINERFVENFKGTNEDLTIIGQVLFVIDTMLQYQRYSKRYIPEIISTIDKLLVILRHDVDSKRQETKDKSNQISISEIYQPSTSTIIKYINKMYQQISDVFDMYKEYDIITDIIDNWESELTQYQNLQLGDTEALTSLINRLTKYSANNQIRAPLTLQSHRKLAIKTYQPKFDENFNPNKNYDLNLDRQEVQKLKHQYKKERKDTLKDLRRQNRFEGNEQLQEKIKKYDEYHSKMANIVNSISTVEGQERNEYQREKKRQK